MADVRVVELPVESIEPNKAFGNDRTVFDAAALQELATSIQNHGLQNPITVRRISPNGKPGRYEIIAGERRWRAAQMAGHATILAIVRVIEDEAASEVMLVENVMRVDLNPVEEALGYQKRMTDFGWTEQVLAQRVGRSLDHIRRRLSLLSLDEETLVLARTGALPLGHAELLAGLDHNRQRIAVRFIRDSSRMPTLSEFRSVVAGLIEQQSQEAMTEFVMEATVHVTVKFAGKKKETGLAVDPTLPTIDTSSKLGLGTGKVMLGYIAALQEQGRDAEALAVSTLLDQLVKGNFVRI